jgi:hypothetical protein
MANAVMTHAPTQPREIHLHRLPRTIQAAFDDLMDKADRAADHRDLATYADRHLEAIELIGIRLPADGELARCTCQNCYCTAVFDAAQAHTYMDGRIEFVQCETCFDRHELTGDE